MKLGILTFHSQLNYGGVLQAFALQEALRDMGHEAIVIDRWLSVNNERINGEFSTKPFIGKIICLTKYLIFLGEFYSLIRRSRTKCFLESTLRLSKPSFFNWSEVSKTDFDVDSFVVGSDQVWNGLFGLPSPYLLKGAPDIPAISYAASFGMHAIPEEMKEAYCAGFKRFHAISCREVEGVKLVKQEGFAATHVVDPTLLLNQKRWLEFSPVKTEQKLVCYLLQEDVVTALPKLKRFAKKMKSPIYLYQNSPGIPFPKNWQTLKKWAMLNWARLFKQIKFENTAGPKEFVDAHASAQWVITDSFHSVMFSSIFDKNVRVIRPTSETRKAMFARIEEFATNCVEGKMIAVSVDDALESFSRGETITFKRDAINSLREKSLAWLEQALTELQDA